MAWFSKVFAPKTPNPEPEPRPPLRFEEDPPKRVVNAPVMPEEPQRESGMPAPRIRARLDAEGRECLLMLESPLLAGNWSFFAPDRDTAFSFSPLAGALFEEGGVESVLVLGMTVLVRQSGENDRDITAFARAMGTRLRAHLASGHPAVLPEFFDIVPDGEALKTLVNQALEREINPGIASHGGEITLESVAGNTVRISMGGGCQGCAASDITLRRGVEKAIRAYAPAVGAVVDVTDHEAGRNPYYTSMP
ncbi:MAG: NifU family protein [Candidatus Hydrogenedentes bacterium]|nr:NifU family protein [Candidatus Hydrogenedentota bacterium]